LTVATAKATKDGAQPTAVVSAWDEYLHATKGLESRSSFPGAATEYESVEPYAWERLKARLRKAGHRLDGNERL
jgi:hypothetical protein